MMSQKAQDLSKRMHDSRQRTDKAKDDVISLCRSALMVLKDAGQKTMAEEMERRLFVLDSEHSEIGSALKEEGALEALIELLSADGKK